MKLNDTHLILLTTASQRDNGSLIPLPESLEDGDRVRKAIAALLCNRMVEEGEVAVAADAWRQDVDKHIGIRITAAGRVAIGLEVGQAIAPGAGGNVVEQTEPAARQTKSHQVLSLLRREGGATLDELITATGWLPHTTRAALTGLRKKGHAVEKGKRGEVTCWLVKAA
ncbi:DUF3489 domain-containing protein [Sphingomonas turrisvirgatae]|uniref:DUF3489 domain-containing protein n=1 Tax=Sphingomonas turrisvirgatae TaxID=1888892 RepID=A0A1E3LVV9_9SPHN|nr:DUF3489 domain-containing protein [Sphingomonas turrisvirgatae]ODP37883.1 hypothetical protein BFL28_16480 [Sphingomonas turrisvirgatae]